MTPKPACNKYTSNCNAGFCNCLHIPLLGSFRHFIVHFCPSLCSLRPSLKGKRPTLSTPCCACWSNTPPIWRTWSAREQRNLKWRDRKRMPLWPRCCPSQSLLRPLTHKNRTNWSLSLCHPDILFLSHCNQVCCSGLEERKTGDTWAFCRGNTVL